MINAAFRQLGIATALLLLWIPGRVFWPFFAGGVILVIGLWMASRIRSHPHLGSDQLIAFGPLLFAIPMAVFGADHYIAAKFVANGVPSWIPGHLFWVYFVGTALIAAALGLATGLQSRLAATLLGVMIFLFVILIHIPNCFAIPYDKTRLTIVLRDSSLSFSALAFAASQFRLSHPAQPPQWPARIATLITTMARFIIGITIAVFGIDHFLNPVAAPGIPQQNSAFVITMPHWIPAHALWSYTTGAIFIACAFGLLAAKRARLAATVFGTTVLVLALFVYLPITLAKPSDIANGLNYLAIHFALAGAAFFLAGALPKDVPDEVSVPERAEPSLRRVSDS